ncbi:hypothetical protein [Pseudomonas fluorescens]|uniref:Uncharacterized protein n=1 Tax=Pseudomonas fluorescens TaxID=294 RepID=A0A0F4V4F3_PSEFL|nr:hypothetical protein [Pseudomonas fluorescens]KJZ63738.1 hypothetical protein VD17_21610 [Pseudomonas fluorescens]
MSERKSDGSLSYVAAQLAEFNTKKLTERTVEFFSDTQRLRDIAFQRRNLAADQAQGWVFEQLEVSKFNLDALRKNASVKAATTDVLGEINNQVADIRITDVDAVVKSYQAKSRTSAAASIFDLTDEKYADVNLVGSSDQYDDMLRLAKRRGDTESIYAERYRTVPDRLDQGIEYDNVRSGGTTRDEAVANTQASVADGTASGMERAAIGNEMHTAGMQAGIVAGTLGAGVSFVSGLWGLHKGEVTAAQVALDTCYSGVGSFSAAYATAAAAKGIPHLLTHMGVGKAAIGALTKSNAHVAIAGGVVQSTKHIAMYLKGDIEFDAMMTEISGTALMTAGSFYYGALGQMIIPIPVVGAMVGSTVGYFVGSILHQSGIISLGESEEVRVSRERREQIEQLCLDVLPRMQASRVAMSQLIEEHFAEQASAISGAFGAMDEAMVSWDADSYVSGLAQLNNTLGCSLPFENFEEFEAFMDDKDSVFVL